MTAPISKGMFPNEPMAECSDCGHQSYWAAWFTGRCLECSQALWIAQANAPLIARGPEE